MLNQPDEQMKKAPIVLGLSYHYKLFQFWSGGCLIVSEAVVLHVMQHTD